MDNERFLNGLGYLGQRAVGGAVKSIENGVDVVSAALADAVGAKGLAQKILDTDWMDYDSANRWFDPDIGWEIGGDIASGIGGSLPTVATALLTGGTSAFGTIATTFAMDFLSSSGAAVKEAYNESGELNEKSWQYAGLTGLFESSLNSMLSGFSSGSKAITDAVEAGIKNSALNGLGDAMFKGFSGGALKGALSSAFEPFFKRATYDKNAEMASVGEVLYQTLIGGLSDMLTTGAAYLGSKVTDTISGNKISKNQQQVNDIITSAQNITANSGNVVINEVLQGIKDVLKKLVDSLKNTGGVIKTPAQKNKLGYLNRELGQAALQPEMMNSLASLLADPQATVDAINSYYGEEKVTLEELVDGIDTLDISSPEFQQNANKYLRNNAVLRNLVVMQTAGRLMLGSKNYAEEIWGNTPISSIATQENLEKILQNNDEATINALSDVLGLDLRTATADEFGESIKKARDNGTLDQYESGIDAINTAKSIEKVSTVLPKSLKKQKESATRYKINGEEFAIIKTGDTYRLYNYNTRKISYAMSEAEVLKAAKHLALVNNTDLNEDNVLISDTPNYNDLIGTPSKDPGNGNVGVDYNKLLNA